MRFRSSVVTLVSLLFLSGAVFGQELFSVPIEVPIPGYYAFQVGSSQLILNTLTGSIIQSAETVESDGHRAPFWDTSGNQLAYYQEWDLYVGVPLGNGTSRVFPYAQTGFLASDWSADGQAVLGARITGRSDPSDSIYRFRLDTGQSEMVAEFLRQEPLPDGLVLVGMANFLSTNKVYGDWVAIVLSGLPPDQFGVTAEIPADDMPLLYNLQTHQRVYLTEYLREPPAHGAYLNWSRDGRRVYLVEDSGWITEFSFSPDGSVTPIASGQIATPLPRDPDYNTVTIRDTLGISDLLITIRSSNILYDPPNRYFTLSRIVDGEVMETDWFILSKDAFNTEEIGSGSFLLTADAAQQQALSCIIDVGPVAQLQAGVSGRVTMTDGSGTRLRSQPGVTGDILLTMPDGTLFTVLNGPYCIDSMKWWQVQLAHGTTGWAAEGSSTGYFLEPWIVETATLTPTPTPTPTETPTPTPTPAAYQKLRLTSMCSANPAVSRNWRVRNPNPYPVTFTWDIYNSPNQQHSSGVVPAAVGSVQGEVLFSTVTEAGANTLRLFVNGAQQDVKASGGATCQ